ncbi:MULTISPECIES: hypothetical protein [unclassified Alistipes]|uniref:hypothetical protein n=1 Tax=unclassified Alistipes TaxID=2608932 RepID=UPI0025860200|nr:MULTISPECIES: hypothetical protein [unclassified Alistipes]HUN14027.1 hypothetical protein [Alistipes sp.]
MKGEKLKVDFAVQRGQRLLAGYAGKSEKSAVAFRLRNYEKRPEKSGISRKKA